MHLDPFMPQLVSIIFIVLALGFTLKIFHQPHVVAYLIVGIIIGPWGMALINDSDIINRLGAVGVVFLLFSVGMETDAKKLVENWKLSIFGTLLQVLLSVGFVWMLGIYFQWGIERIILIGFVISLSSTAIVIKLLQDTNTLDTKVGQGALGILLAQDLAIIPMLIIIGLYQTDAVENIHIGKQIIGSLLAAAILAFIIVKKEVRIPLSKWLKNDHELQLFAGLGICFGLSMLTAWFELSTALGAFLGGMLISAAKETQWVHHNLNPLKVLFVALFFISVGMMLDVTFLIQNWQQVITLVMIVLITNTFINAGILKISKFSWKESLYTGALLSQIGEFSFVLTAVGNQANIINQYGYQLAICIISLSLLISPMWIALSKKLIKYDHQIKSP
jgi:CPA2 family monovalent cation:H+ antiporter-2